MSGRMRMLGGGGDCLADIDEEALQDLDRQAMVVERAASGHPDLRNRARDTADSLQDAPAFPVSADHFHPFFRSPASPDTAWGAEASEPSEFLAELAREVAARRQQGAVGAAAQERAKQLHHALFRIFGFLNQLARYANELAPEISRIYRLDAQNAYAGLRWQSASADYRKQDMSEDARVSHVSFRASLVAPQALAVVRRWDQVAALKRDLHLLELRSLNEPAFAGKAGQEFVAVQVAPEIPVQIRFQGNYDNHRIEVSCRNLEGLCLSSFVVDVDQVSQSLLGDLGRFLLSRSTVLPSALRRVHGLSSNRQIQ